MSDNWPICDLDYLEACPVCHDPNRSVMFSGLRDYAFASAPGEWTMWRCGSCNTAYLDPRPTLGSIWRAYTHYYTHAGMTQSLWHRFAAGFANDYINKNYGYGLRAIPFGAMILRASSRKRRSADHKIRHLPAPLYSTDSLLDVGCGNGDFLKLARKLGFQPTGLDPDEQAIKLARQSGLVVRKGNLPGSGFADNSFNHVTANHVLEHLHQPLEALEEIWKLLKPGGRLWISQPNLGANGLKQFGIYWRGLEPPRHLTLFDTEGMGGLLRRCGFVEIELLPPDLVASFYYRQSLWQESGTRPDQDKNPPSWNKEWDKRTESADAAAESDPRVAESFTIIARRPH